MNLPADTVIAPEKLRLYLLVPQARGDKSSFLEGAGYTLENAPQLLIDLRAQLLPLDPHPPRATSSDNITRRAAR